VTGLTGGSNQTDSEDRALTRISGSSGLLADVDLKPSGKAAVHVFASADQNSANPEFDAFGRARVSSPETIFDTSFRWDKQPITWSESVTSGGTVTHNADKASVDLACTTTTNSEAIFQSRQYMRYHPAKSTLIVISGSFLSTGTNVRKRIGYFDDSNGVFFQLDGTTLSVVRRTKTSGSVVDNTTAQASWNIDPLDGSGGSGITLDVTKQQIFVIDYQWLGSGRIRYGFYIGGRIIYCHEDLTANVLAVPWSQTGDNPVRTEIKNSGSTASSMHITCAAVICENFWSPEGILRTANNGTTARSLTSIGSTLPVISLRKQSAYINVPVKIMDFGVFGNSSDDFIMSIIYNGSLTGASFANVAGVCQVDTSATAISGGTTLYSEYLRGSSSAPSMKLAEIFHESVNAFLGRDLAGNSDQVTVLVTAVTASSSAMGLINYKEFL
jgi:hypothetical protein